MKVYMLIADGGDGSACIRFFKNVEIAMKAAEEDEEFYMNEGSPTEIDAADDWSPMFGFDDKHWE